jgi:hypothetical protein
MLQRCVVAVTAGRLPSASVGQFSSVALKAGAQFIQTALREMGLRSYARACHNSDQQSVLVGLPKQKRAGGGASTLELKLVDQTIFCRLRRAKPTSPAQAITRPGSPAPTMGPGTVGVVKKVLAQVGSTPISQTCPAKVLPEAFGAVAKLVPLRVIVIVVARGGAVLRLSTTVNVPNPSTLPPGDCKVLSVEVTPLNVKVSELAAMLTVLVEDRLTSAAWLSTKTSPALAVNVQVKDVPPPEQLAVKGFA